MMQLRYVHLLLVTTTLLAPLVRPPPVAASMTTGRAPILSVAVLLHQRSIQIGGTRGFRVLDHRTSGQLDLQWGGTRVAVDGWMAGLKFRNGNYHKLVVCPTSGGFVLINGKPYRGYFELHEDGRGGVNAVNIVDLESYLYGVVKAEMSASAPLEAL
ncbi:MAG: SpoIID/LytB domain-containing protein, partial [Candidatus Riflebacteria bacterium]|nr:SpoIID/LytB domain-containing protein [Candidatus Riflebacteria bacterium]